MWEINVICLYETNLGTRISLPFFVYLAHVTLLAPAQSLLTHQPKGGWAGWCAKVPMYDAHLTNFNFDAAA